jgi:hypothetical protein
MQYCVRGKVQKFQCNLLLNIYVRRELPTNSNRYMTGRYIDYLTVGK